MDKNSTLFSDLQDKQFISFSEEDKRQENQG